MTNKERLLEVAKRGDAQTVLCALDAGANVNAADKYGETALMPAACNGHVEVVKALLSAGADVNAAGKYDGRTALMAAAKDGHAEVVKVLLSAGAEVNAADQDGKTALMEAAGKGDAEVVSVLVDAGADVDATDKYGHTAEMLAGENVLGPPPDFHVPFLASPDHREMHAYLERGAWLKKERKAKEKARAEVVPILRRRKTVGRGMFS